jgi:hypothetical protein
MQYVNQAYLHLISPKQVVAGQRVCYYSLSPILEGNILYTVTQERTTLFRAGKTTCTRRKRGIRIGGTERNPQIARYIVTTYLQEINEGPERDAALKDMVALEALPF